MVLGVEDRPENEGRKKMRPKDVLTCIGLALVIVGVFYIAVIESNYAWSEIYDSPEGIGFPVMEEPSPEKGCPETNFTDNNKCMACHVLVKDGSLWKFGIREVKPFAEYDFPRYTSIIDGKLNYYMREIDSDYFWDFVKYVRIHPEFGKTISIEVDSYGGSIFQAWRIKSIIVEMEKRGYIIETKTRGIALSAGFIVFVSGSIGHRTVDRNAEFMMHELWSIEWPKIATPATKEEDARIYKHLQDNINSWIAQRGNMTKEQIDQKVKFKEAWLTGREMIEYGFADGVIK